MSTLLEARQLTKVYESKKIALDKLDLTITSGKIIGLLGPNGSGKTTFIKLVNGLLKPSSGEVLIDGMAPSEHTKAIVSYLPDCNYFDKSMKITQMIDIFENFYTDFSREKAMSLLSDLQIDVTSQFKTLSKGTKEKVQLILVMSRNAKLYILDEPMAGIDPAARSYILNTIIQNYNPDATVIISTHLIADIEAVLDEVVFIQNGRKIVHTSTDAIRGEYGKSVDAYFREVFSC